MGWLWWGGGEGGTLSQKWIAEGKDKQLCVVIRGIVYGMTSNEGSYLIDRTEVDGGSDGIAWQ